MKSFVKLCICLFIFTCKDNLTGQQLRAKNDMENAENVKRIRQNLLVLPLVESNSEQGFRLHQMLYSLLWMKRRIAFGTEKHYRQIPQVSFYFDEEYYAAKVDNFWIDYPKDSLAKTVNVTITVQKITDIINDLHNNFFDRKGMSVRQQAKTPQHGNHHYLYFIQSNYHCEPSPLNPGNRCEDWQYYLDAIYVDIQALQD